MFWLTRTRRSHPHAIVGVNWPTTEQKHVRKKRNTSKYKQKKKEKTGPRQFVKTTPLPSLCIVFCWMQQRDRPTGINHSGYFSRNETRLCSIRLRGRELDRSMMEIGIISVPTGVKELEEGVSRWASLHDRWIGKWALRIQTNFLIIKIILKWTI